jgi:hypothetical protein
MTISDHPPLAPSRTHRTRVAPASPDRLDLLQPLASPSDAGGAFASYGRGGSPAADDGVRPADVTAAVDGTSASDSYSLIVAIRRHVNRSSVAIAFGAAWRHSYVDGERVLPCPPMTIQRDQDPAAAPAPRKRAAAAHPGGGVGVHATSGGLVTAKRLRLGLRLLLVIAAVTVLVLALGSAG